MTRAEIVEILARDKVVEQLVCNIAHAPLSANLRDLSQMAYLILLTYDEEKIIRLWESGAIRFFLARVISTQLHSPRSPYQAIICRHSQRSTEITDFDLPSTDD